MSRLFGTDGIRGLAEDFPLDPETVARIGFSLAQHLKEANGTDEPPSIIIGRDTRESGPAIESALAAGAAAAGAHIESAGVITTPGVAFLTRDRAANAGVVISASHNPYQDNGIKIFAPSGRKLNDGTERAIESDLTRDRSFFPAFADRTCVPDLALKEEYLAFLKDHVAAGLDLTGMRIVIDCAEGAAYELAPRLFASLGADVVSIHVSPDGRNINLNCGSLHPDELQRRVVAEDAHLGIAFDGDADRMLLVDEGGRLMDGDYVLYILACDLKDRNSLDHDRVVATVMSNMGLELALRERGIDLARTAVGDKYVLEELVRGGGSLGGEQSGHIIFPKISLAGDGMITALELLRVVRSSGRTVSDLASGFTRLPQVLLNVPVGRKPALETIAPVARAIREVEASLDGRGRLLVRYSGTENLARVMIEGENGEEIQKHATSLADLISRELS